MAIHQSDRSESVSSGETSASAAAARLRDNSDTAGGKSSKSIASVSTEDTCVHSDPSASGGDDDDYGDREPDTVVVVAETVESSDDEDTEEAERAPKSRERNPTARRPASTRVPTIVDRSRGPAPGSSSSAPFAATTAYRPGLVLRNRVVGADDRDLGESRAHAARDLVRRPEERQEGGEDRRADPARRRPRHAKRPAVAREEEERRRRPPSSVPVPRREQTVSGVRRKKREARERRETGTTAGAVAGMVAGAAILGPAGIVPGAAVGGFCARKASETTSRGLRRRRERRAFRDHAASRGLRWHRNGDAAVFV